MSPRRLPEPLRRSRPLVVLGLAAALVAVPGTALAEGAPAPVDPLGQVTDQLGSTLGDLTAPLAGGAGQLGDPGTGQPPAAVPPAPAGAPAVPAPDPAQLDPAELEAQLAALLGTLQVSPECTSAVAADLEALLASVPATVEQVVAELQAGLDEVLADPAGGGQVLQDRLTELVGGLAGGGAPAPGEDPIGLPVVTAVEQLVQDLLTTCLPQPVEETQAPPPPAPAAPPAAPPVAAAPTGAAPVAYLGYAPTGAPEEEPGGGLPVAAFGGVLLLTAAGAGTWVRARRAAARD